MNTQNPTVKLLVVVGCCTDDAPRAERLLDFIYWQNDRKADGHALIVVSPDVHAELQKKLSIAAELAFESFDLIVAKASDLQTNGGKPEHVNNLIRNAAITVQRSYAWPWIWLEPDCVPLTPSWKRKLFDEYDAQPRPYMGARLKLQSGDVIPTRQAIYPRYAGTELDPHLRSEVPFERAAYALLLPKFAKTKLIQQFPIAGKEDIAKVRTDAVLLHGDKKQILLNHLFDGFQTTQGIFQGVNVPVSERKAGKKKATATT